MRILVFTLSLMIPSLLTVAQVYHTCPVHNLTGVDYENRLNEKWLSAYDVKFYDLHLAVSNTSTHITGKASILLETVRELDTLVLELQDALSVSGVSISDQIHDPQFVDLTGYQHVNHAIYIPLDRRRNPSEQFLIRIEYAGEAGQERGFFAGITSAVDPGYGFPVTYTLSEPLNAKDWFPVKQVLEDKIDSVWVHLQCDQQLMAASNGLLESIELLDPDTHVFHWHTRYPMAYYLLSFAVADYRDFSFNASLSGEGDSVLVQNYVYDTDQVLLEWEDDIRATGDMITLFSDLLMDYPFWQEKYGHAMAPMGGGMEHQTMTTIHDFSFYLVAHELAHQWFGDYITCGNWQDIWINEGFASYMEYVAAQRLLGQQAADGWMANAMSIALGETEGSVYVPMEGVEDTYRLFDYGLSYKKGAILLHMIRYRLNDDERFFLVLRNYLDQYGSGLALGADFMEILEAESNIDFSCFFEQWYYGEGFPRFNLQWYQEGDSLMIHSEQVSSAPHITPFFATPFDLEIWQADGTNHRVRLMQDAPEEDYSVAVEGVVEEILFDPDTWLLKTVTVNHQIPPDQKFVYGPNPVSEELYIQFKNTSQIDEILITTLSGQEVIRYNLVDNPVTINMSALADGPYLLVIQDADQTYLERVVKISIRYRY